MINMAKLIINYTTNVIVNRKHNIIKLTYFAARVCDYILVKQHLYDETHM